MATLERTFYQRLKDWSDTFNCLVYDTETGKLEIEHRVQRTFETPKTERLSVAEFLSSRHHDKGTLPDLIGDLPVDDDLGRKLFEQGVFST